jgi:hypothetical protein
MEREGPTFLVLDLSFFLLDCYLATIVSASGTYGVVDVEFAAVGAYCQCGSYGLVMSTTLKSACLGLSSFRMCHCDLLFNDLFIIQQVF